MSNPLSASIHSQNFEATDLNRAFRFLHLLTRRLSLAGAIAHFHLDPETCDEKTIETSDRYSMPFSKLTKTERGRCACNRGLPPIFPNCRARASYLQRK